MKHSVILAVLIAVSGICSVFAAEAPVLVRAKFVNADTWRVECKGFPSPGTTDIQARETAREAALTMAQAIAHDTFDDTVNTDACGLIIKYKGSNKYQIIIYEVSKPGLKSHAKKK